MSSEAAGRRGDVILPHRLVWKEGTKGWQQKTSLESCSPVNSNVVDVGRIFCLREPSAVQLCGLTVYVGCNYNKKIYTCQFCLLRNIAAQLCAVKKGPVFLFFLFARHIIVGRLFE